MSNKTVTILLILNIVVSLGGYVFPRYSGVLGGTSHFSGPIDSLAGYDESGMTVIDTNGNFLGSINSTSTATSTFQAPISLSTSSIFFSTSSNGPVVIDNAGACVLLGIDNSTGDIVTSSVTCPPF